MSETVYREYPLEQGKNGFIRIWDENVLESDLVWHRDKETRVIEVMESGGWQFQTDNNPPIKLEKGMKYTIPKMVYHRLIKGQFDLVLRLKKV